MVSRLRKTALALPVRRLCRAFAAVRPAGREPRPTLYLSWGRLGDSILQSGFTRHYRQWFSGPLVAVARPEAGPILREHVDRFVPLEAAALRSRRARNAFLAQLPKECATVLGDIHLFHSGDLLTGLLDAVAAERRFAYAGWADPGAVAPCRPLPVRAEIVAARSKARAATDPEAVHVFGDLLHYHAAILGALGRPAPEAALCLPRLPQGCDGAPPAHGGRDHVACHAAASQGKKDWPRAAFHDVIAAFPRLTFALLGTAADAAGCTLGGLPNVVDLRGRTTVLQAIGTCASARAFVGVDSGLAHAAAAAGTPTVVAMPASSRGYFFPYPQALGTARVEAVFDPDYRACAGCLGLCEHEPIWRSRRRGFPCLRNLPPQAVVAALQRALRADGGPPDPDATPGGEPRACGSGAAAWDAGG